MMNEPSLSITTNTEQLNMDSDSTNESNNVLSQIQSQTQQPDEAGVISQSVPPPVLESQPWGFLSCIRSHMDIRLVKDEFLVGRNNPSADYVFEEKSLRSHYKETSHEHFRIIRTPLKSGQWKVSIEDLSSGGTFVNGILIGKGKKRVLPDKSKISVTLPGLDVFVFYDQQYKVAVPGIPAEITANYLIEDDIGRGGFGRVYLVMKQNSQKRLAMKAIKLKEDTDTESATSRSGFLNEPNIMYKIKHPNIVQIHDVYISEGSFLFIFMDYVKGGDLSNYLRVRNNACLSESQAKFIIYQLLRALDVLHKQKIVHRDIKPANILCSNRETAFPHIKLTDFGLSKTMSNGVEPVNTLCGTRTYAAPELNLMFRAHRRGLHYYDSRCDIWSVGLVFYFCLCQRQPYGQQNKNVSLPEIERTMRKNSFKFEPVERWESITFSTKFEIRRMLRFNFGERPLVEQLLSSPYFKEDQLLRSRYSRLLERPTTNARSATGDENSIPKKMRRLE